MWTPGLGWLVLLLLVAVFDIWLAKTSRPTLTQWVRKQDRQFPWFRWVVIGAMAFLMYHFFWQGA